MQYRLGLYEKAMPAGLCLRAMLAATREAGFDFLELSVDETDERQARLHWSEVEKRELLYAMRATEKAELILKCISVRISTANCSRKSELEKAICRASAPSWCCP